MKLTLSALPHTWILDVDGTLVKHNGYKLDGYDTLLPGVKEFYASIPVEDKIVLLTARTGEQLDALKQFLDKHALRYDHILTDMPVGERILINDDKPSGLKMAHIVNLKRDAGLFVSFEIDHEI